MTTPSTALPTGDDVAAFLGEDNNPSTVAMAGQHVEIVKAMLRSYVRGRGFGPDGTVAGDLAAVIITATARLLANPEQDEYSAVGPVIQRGGFRGWSLAETFVLNAYRRRAS